MNLLSWTMAPNTRVTRKWEVFAGRNKFYCDGYFMSAPHVGVFYLTIFLITGTSALFFAFDCPYLAQRITPAIPIIGALLYFITMSSLLRTTFTDPGIIPRASHDEAAYIEKQIEVPNSLNSPTYRPPPRTKEVLVKGQTIKLKYCFTCKIFRPPRASHCSLCDNCVDRFDHHCPWVGNCVGKRNYRFFYMFIVSLAFLAVFIFACSLTHIVLLTKDDKEFVEVLQKAPFSMVVTLICFASIWSVIGLAGFHTYLTTSDQTTNEDIKGSFSSKGGHQQQSVNPYSRGNICLNCLHILCGPMTPSLIDKRGIVTDEYRIQMQSDGRQYYASQPQNVINVAPMLNPQPSDGVNKSKLYDLELGASLPNDIYRQRSYENLHNDNSNSVAHLVENEIPLSNLTPIQQTDNDEDDDMIMKDDDCVDLDRNVDDILATGVARVNDHDDDDIDDNNQTLGNLNASNFNKMSGSYNNLFTDKLADQLNEESDFDAKDVAAITRHSENVYSNIQSVNGAVVGGGCGGGVGRRLSDCDESIQSDPNFHVYSNISASTSVMNESGIEHEGGMMDAALSTTFLHDDLDLDDPVTAADANNSFAKSSHKSHKTLTATSGKRKKSSGDAAVPKLTKKSVSPQLHSEPMVEIIQPSGYNGVTVVTSATITPVASTATTSTTAGVATIGSGGNNAGAVTNAVGVSSNSNSSNNTNFISPSRMRLLHDTTMIDTALDLDSLDGSSIGNNSQVCLVKTAIV